MTYADAVPAAARAVREARPRRDARGPRAAGATPALLFPLGQLAATPAALDALAEAAANPVQYLARHATGDWGELDPADRAANNSALRTDERILSEYRLPTGARLWIITEADRSVTTLLLPSDY